MRDTTVFSLHLIKCLKHQTKQDGVTLGLLTRLGLPLVPLGPEQQSNTKCLSFTPPYRVPPASDGFHSCPSPCTAQEQLNVLPVAFRCSSQLVLVAKIVPSCEVGCWVVFFARQSSFWAYLQSNAGSTSLPRGCMQEYKVKRQDMWL